MENPKLESADSPLSFRNISMNFPDGTRALADVSFDVGKGEFVTVVGPSGCGKSTLLRIASGLLKHTSGEVVVDRTNIGYVFQDATLFPWRTVRRNVQVLMELHGTPKADRAAATQRVIDLVGLGGFENHYPKSLSGGMKMRASLARTLTLKPPVLMFDEPFGAVDEITREYLNEETLKLFQQERFAGLLSPTPSARRCSCPRRCTSCRRGRAASSTASTSRSNIHAGRSSASTRGSPS